MLSFEDFQKIDLKIAEIKDAREHPNADKLLVLMVDIEGETRQIVAGIRSSYKVEDLCGKKIIVVANLEPAVIRGEESNGMLLAASSDNVPVLLVPERDVPSGSKVK